MAEGKVIGKLTNIVNFSTDKASLNKVLADIKKVKDAMKAAMSPITAARNSTKLDPALKRQREINKAHTQAIIEDRKRAADAIAKIQNEELKNNKKAVNEQNALNKRNKNRDESAQATTYGFRQMFGRGGARKASALYDQYREGKLTYAMYNKEISLLRNNLFKAQRAQRSFNQSIHDMRGAFVQATASYTAFAGVMGIADIGKKFQGYQSSLSMAFGGEQESAPYVEYLRKEIRRLGLDVQTTTDDFSKLAVAASGKLQGGDLKSLFTGYMEYANVAGASAERISNGVVAMQQMLSKGRITAEEFRGQMAEQVVGSDKAFRAAVEEMIGRALKEGELEQMMSKGLLDPKKLFPLVGKYFAQFARQGGALEKKLKQLAAVESRMKESWIQFVKRLYDTGVESALSNLYKGLDRIFYSIKNLAGNALGKYLKGILDMLSETALFVLDTFQLVLYCIDKAFGNDSNLKGISAEMLGMATGAGLVYITLSKLLGLFKGLNILAKIFKSLLIETAAVDVAGGLAKQSSSMKGVGSLLGKALGVAMVAAAAYEFGGWLRDNVSWIKTIGDYLGTRAGQLISPNQQDAANGRGAFAAMNGAGFNAAWASSMPMFMQNQQPQTAKVELTLNGELSKMVDVKIKENNTQIIQSILPMSKN